MLKTRKGASVFFGTPEQKEAYEKWRQHLEHALIWQTLPAKKKKRIRRKMKKSFGML